MLPRLQSPSNHLRVPILPLELQGDDEPAIVQVREGCWRQPGPPVCDAAPGTGADRGGGAGGRGRPPGPFPDGVRVR